ncbi:sugar phosphate isomerase/epimerase [Micromonospora sp. M71_S20]|uniref:sugar phosphate isomerase/epimerase family protein n=1 Tax=Micromonospora sp. M71_S20 TaxID=592872 RepID=UPI000EADFB34|nr:sugar phosphate isomerase/epimerase family protein [Micromonospora sp. M71_S20]RLK25021.1 sugar phosphate isomerase/epimerase [Micromonospora sp. M71_S20]
MTIPLACQEQLLPGTDLIQKYALATALGYDAIELRGSGDLGLARRLPELRRARAAGVLMPTVCVEMDHFIGDFDPDRSRDAVRNLRSQLSVIAEVGGVGAMTPAAWGMFSRRLPPFEPPRSPAGDRQVLVDALGELGEHARAEGVTLFLEPLNRYEDHMVNRLADAVALCAAVGLPSVRVVADTFHMNIEEDDVHRAVRAAAPYLGHVQVSDSNRHQPGAGHLDWPALVRTLLEIDYRGWLALECRLRGDPVRALHQAAAVLRHAQPRQAAA